MSRRRLLALAIVGFALWRSLADALPTCRPFEVEAIAFELCVIRRDT